MSARLPRNVAHNVQRAKALGHAPVSGGSGHFRCQRCNASGFLDHAPDAGALGRPCPAPDNPTRPELENEVWKATHRDYRGVTDGIRHVLQFVPGTGTCSVALVSLTDADLISKLPRARRDQINAIRAALAGASGAVNGAGKDTP